MPQILSDFWITLHKHFWVLQRLFQYILFERGCCDNEKYAFAVYFGRIYVGSIFVFLYLTKLLC